MDASQQLQAAIVSTAPQLWPFEVDGASHYANMNRLRGKIFKQLDFDGKWEMILFFCGVASRLFHSFYFAASQL